MAGSLTGFISLEVTYDMFFYIGLFRDMKVDYEVYFVPYICIFRTNGLFSLIFKKSRVTELIIPAAMLIIDCF